MMNTSTYGNAVNQYGLLAANFLGNSGSGVPLYGTGLSRRLVQNIAGGWRLQSNAPHPVTDGSGALFYSCIADPHLAITGLAAPNPYDCEVYLATIPVQPTADGKDRTKYLTIPITIGTVGGASYAILKYGYEENEPTRGATFPPTINYYCTQYQAGCFWGATGAPVYTVGSGTHIALSSTTNLQIGVPQRVLAYNILYFNGSNVQVGSSGLQWLAIDSVATNAGPASAPAPATTMMVMETK